MIESQITETPITVASHYDDLDLFYREIWGLHIHHGLWRTGKESSSLATVELLEHLMHDVELPDDARVCDVGCGYGETSRYLANWFNVKVTGLSVSEKQLNFARSLGKNSSVELLLQDWMKNDLPSESYDLVISIESSEHMPDLKRFFKEAYRVLRPGGTLKVCAWLSKNDPGSWELRHLLQPICTEGRIRLCDVNEYTGLIQETGFREHRFEEISDQVKKTWSLCLKRCAWKFMTDPKYLSFMMKDASKNKRFLVSLLRIRLAYETRSMLYGIFTAVK